MRDLEKGGGFVAGYSSLMAVDRKHHLVADPTAAAVVVGESVFGPA